MADGKKDVGVWCVGTRTMAVGRWDAGPAQGALRISMQQIMVLSAYPATFPGALCGYINRMHK